jgi:hypothetical protein
MDSFFDFNLMCICEHILCFWLVDFFVLLMIGERASINIFVKFWDLTTYWTLFLNLLYHALDVTGCAFVWTHFIFLVHALVVHIINLFQKYIFIFNFIFLIFKNYILINLIDIMDNTIHTFWPSLIVLYYSHMNDKRFKWRHLPFYVHFALVSEVFAFTNKQLSNLKYLKK